MKRHHFPKVAGLFNDADDFDGELNGRRDS
jgi:hypothetical protein